MIKIGSVINLYQAYNVNHYTWWIFAYENDKSKGYMISKNFEELDIYKIEEVDFHSRRECLSLLKSKLIIRRYKKMPGKSEQWYIVCGIKKNI